MIRTLAIAGVIFATAATLGGPAAAQTAPSAAASPDGEVFVRIVAALDEAGGIRAKAAQLLGMGRTTLWRKMKEYGLE